MTESPPGYRPGVCNIGSTERRRRYRYAGISGVAAVAYAAIVLAWSVPTALLLGLFVPLSLGTEFLLQARRSFCASLGFCGRFDLRGKGTRKSDSPAVADGGGGGDDGAAGVTGRVTDPAARAADRRYALRLTVLGVLGGSAGTALVYGIALLFG